MRILGIDNSGAEKQIYRLMTEATTQLQNIMVEEDIPNMSWLEPPSTPAKVEDDIHVTYATPLEYATTDYRRLLEKVISQAQRIPGEESEINPFSMTCVRRALDETPLPSDIHQILGIQES